jgi:hypothetical protein
MKWLDRRVAAPGPYLALCLSEREFFQAAKHCRIKKPGEWIKTPQADATAHYWVSDKHELTVVVCLSNYEKRTGVEIAGLLVHEAVHVWQEYASRLGETAPGAEQEAYAVQGIAQELMAEYARRIYP